MEAADLISYNDTIDGRQTLEGWGLASANRITRTVADPGGG